MDSQEGSMFIKCMDDTEMEESPNIINERINCQEDFDKWIYKLKLARCYVYIL